MKEATGELSNSMIVFAAVALLSFFFFSVIWPGIRGNMVRKSTCADAVCDVGYNDKGLAYCYSPGDKNKGDFFECPYKG